MIQSIRDELTQDIYDGTNSKAARKFPKKLHESARNKLDMLNAAQELMDLRSPPGNRLKALEGNLKGYFSIRINDQWRILFKWTHAGAEDVHIVDYH